MNSVSEAMELSPLTGDHDGTPYHDQAYTLSPGVPITLGNLSVRVSVAPTSRPRTFYVLNGTTPVLTCAVAIGDTTCTDGSTVTVQPGSLLAFEAYSTGSNPTTDVMFGLTAGS